VQNPNKDEPILESKLTSSWTFILYLVEGKLIAFRPSVKTNWLPELKNKEKNRPGNNKEIEHESLVWENIWC
jgi:hypothetical protein